MMTGEQSALVIGYTGATGKALVEELASTDQFNKVVLIGRRNVQYDDAERQKFEQRVINFEKLSELKEEFSGFDVVFCCLGTTRKDAGSAEAFRRVDHDYVHQMALHCKEGGTKHFHYVSSAGASASSAFLYARVKGEIENALADVNFDRLSIYRPMLLMRGDALRPGERCLLVTCKPVTMCCPWATVTPCDLLSRAMINNCNISGSNKEILENKPIYRLAAIA